MKKIIIFLMFLTFVSLLPLSLFAEEQASTKPPMMGKMMMMGAMMKKSMDIGPDGSIYVLAGNKLIKYDKDLNLVKQVEVMVGMEGMKDCPMIKDMGQAPAQKDVSKPEADSLSLAQPTINEEIHY